MAFELIVRWGDPREADEPREAKVYSFATETERNAYRDGIIEARPDGHGYDFYARNSDGSIPEDEEWAELNPDEDSEEPAHSVPFDPHSESNHRAVVEELKKLGHPATLEYGFIGVDIGNVWWNFGTANDTWSGNTDTLGDWIETDQPIQETDAAKVAQAISTAIKAHEAKEQ